MRKPKQAEPALGLMAGMGLCLLVYTLVQWWMLRDVMFWPVRGHAAGHHRVFCRAVGVGSMCGAPARGWCRTGRRFSSWWVSAVPSSSCCALAGAQRTAPRVATVIALAGTVGLTATGVALGLLGYGAAQGIGMALGQLALLLVLPTAFRRLRDGDRAAAYVLAGSASVRWA